MKCYIEVVTVGDGAPKLTILDDVPTHDTDMLMYLKPHERYGWLNSRGHLIVAKNIQSFITAEVDEWNQKRNGVHIRVIDTHE